MARTVVAVQRASKPILRPGPSDALTAPHSQITVFGVCGPLGDTGPARLRAHPFASTLGAMFRIQPRALGLLLLVGSTQAADWPQFLGPDANGHSRETGLLDSFPTNGTRVLWDKPIGSGYSAPSIRGGRLVLHHRQGDEEVVECLSTATAARQWRHADPSQFVDPYGYNNGPRATPLLTTNRCYTFGAEGRLDCLDLESGRVIWTRETAMDWNVPPAFFGVGSSPVLEGSTLLVMVGGQPNAGMAGLDAATGRTLWESVGERSWTGIPMTGWPGERTVVWRPFDKQASYATPVLTSIHGRRTALCLMRQGLVALDPQTGTVHFSRWFRAQAEESVNAANPIVADDLICFSAAYYRVGAVCVRVKPGGSGFDEVWRGPVLETHWATPILEDGFLYAFTGRNEPDARFRCVELKTGALKWDRDESWAHRGSLRPSVYGRGSAMLADGKLIVLGEGGLLGLFRVNPEKPEELARWQVPSLRYPCWAGPVLADGRLYLRSEDRLVCLDLRADDTNSSKPTR